ncbi:hypothetical protein [Hydrogenophaga sp.]|uniref:hypothetical protein n=1 Tax=Hydrogenophaga sp. TaxID=1904254 RepID=UPI0027199CED|nr:hypothetical protein [Hydrogenophaga sp.]MDO8905223.1 hypothetical protein [Hydrogenophaga sp.]
MLDTLWPLLLFFAFPLVLVVWLARRQARERQQREDSLRTAAVTRGWSFDAQQSGSLQSLRWQGVTVGTRWTLEYRLHRRSKRSKNTQVHRAVWWADTFRGPASPVLFIGVPTDTQNPMLKLAQSEGVLASMAQKAAGFALDKGLDAYFGEEAGLEVDARLLKPVEAAGLPGFMVMAADVPQAMWLLGDGWSKSLEALVQKAGASIADRPWVLVLPRRVYVARPAPMRTEQDVQTMVDEGLALVASHV